MAEKPNATIISEPSDVASDLSKRPIVLSDPTGSNSDGDTISGYDIIDPTTGTGSFSGSGTRRKPGRPKGSRNVNPGPGPEKVTTISKTVNLAGFESLLLSVHMMGAAILKTPELMLDSEECKRLSAAVVDVARFYPVGMSEKTLAWANLIMVAGAVYGSRLVAISARHTKERENKPKPFLMPKVSTTPEPERGTPVMPTQQTNRTAPSNIITSPSQIYGSYNGVDDSVGGFE